MNKITLPLEEAVAQSAKQNFDRDKKMGVFEDGESWESESEMYLEEARHLLETTGSNYIPDYPDHPYIVLE